MTRKSALMIQGTGSNVGKSVIVAGLCRLFTRQGLAVRPFKPQNMSNNAAVAMDGGEIGRAQALQAQAAGVATSIHMNPVLLKPQSDRGSQIVVQGRVYDTLDAKGYAEKKAALMPAVLESFQHLEAEADLVIVEGAGSPAEVNLRAGDLANMGFACAANVPVVLCADIDRGGVIASLVGTHAVLDADDKAPIQGFFINRFRGDPSLFDEGLAIIESRTGWPSLGLVPWFDRAHHLPAEDVLGLAQGTRENGSTHILVAVPRLGRIANFEDLDPLRLEPEVDLRIIEPGTPLPVDADCVLLPGSKTTIADLTALRDYGWDIDIQSHVRRGGWVVGLCGGYQMLGRTLADPDGIEGPSDTVNGLGLLPIDTVLARSKQTRLSQGHEIATGHQVSGYEIHLGETKLEKSCPSFLLLETGEDGARSADGKIMGTYLHGLFASDTFRASFLQRLGGRSDLAYQNQIETVLDALADHLERSLDTDRLLEIARRR